MKRQRRASTHTLALLDALLQRSQGWHYGYDLSRVTELKSGTLYPILMLESKWQPAVQEGRPARHMYRLTAAGLVFARASLVEQPVGRKLGSTEEYA